MSNCETTVQHTKNMSIPNYCKMKIKMLEKDFCVALTEEEKAHAKTLTTEAALDQFAIGILDKRWG